MRKYFDHEKLDVYRAAIGFVILVDEMIRTLPRGRPYLADQLEREATSVPLYIADEEYSSNKKISFYRMAKRSATECASILDICNELQLIDQHSSTQGRSLLLRIVAMLIKLSNS